MTGRSIVSNAGRYFVVLLIVGSEVGLGQQSRDVPRQTPELAGSTAHLSGRVLDSTSAGRPLRRAIVTLSGPTMPAGRSVITDDEGRFAFEGLPPGDYSVQATRPAFLKNAYGATRPGRQGTPISLAAGQRTTDVTVSLPHGSAIEGMLRDTAGDVAPGMRVEAIRVMRSAHGERGERLGLAWTDDRGVYRVYGLPAGDYVLVATPAVIVGGLGEIGAPTEAEVDALFADVQRRIGGAPAQTTPPGTGRQSDRGTPAAQSAHRGVSTPATYYPGVVSSGEAIRVTIGPNDERVGVDFAMTLSRAAAVSGRVVVESGQALPQITVQIRPYGPELPVFAGSASASPSVMFDRASGAFRIANVPPGRYRVVARSLGEPGAPGMTVASGGALAPPGAGGTQVLWAEADIHVAGDDLPGVTLTLQRAPALTGRIAFGPAGTAPAATSVRVQLEPVALPGEPSNGQTAALVAQGRPDGSFAFSAVIPGAYRMTASGPRGWWARSARLASRDLLDDLVIVRAESVAGVILTMTDQRTSIGGTLSTPAGHPAPGYFVVVFPVDRELWRWPSRRIASARPATNGAFEFQDLVPGDYRLAVVTDLDDGDLGDSSFLEALVGVAVTVTLGEGERKIQHLRIGG